MREKVTTKISKINKMKVFLFFLGFSLAFHLSAQNAEIKFLDTNISIDGKLNESVWQQLHEYTNFYNYLPTDEGLAENQTFVKLFHNGTYLYVSAVYKDTTSRSQVSTLKRDVPIGLSDGFVMILDTQNQQQNAYYFSVNAYSVLIDGLVERIDSGFDFSTSWNTIWEAKVTIQENNKIYEIAIPLKALNFNSGNTTFGIQFYTRDIKRNEWTIFKNVKRNYRLFDLRFTESFSVENLPDRSTSRFAIIPSITSNYQNDVQDDKDKVTFKPSFDIQYNLTSSVKLDATINPDFSQIDVDQQVTNLTRFSVFFPEQRNFFLENADLFSNLGTDDVNPFYSRRVGANSDIQFGLKLSGNLTPKTRMGFLNTQTEIDDNVNSQNITAFVAEQQLSKSFTTTGFLINRQQTDKFEFIDDYNRVAGMNLNYKSNNNRWTGLVNFGKSFNDDLSGDNDFYNVGIWYNKRGLEWNLSLKSLGKNYITDVGFTPRLYNYDALNDEVIREGYTQVSASSVMSKFPEKSTSINEYRFFNVRNNTYFDEGGTIVQSSSFFNNALFFKDLSAVYINFYHDYVDLKYAFDPLGNENVLLPGQYRYFRGRVGYNSVSNKKFVFRAYLHHGQFYNGKRSAGFLTASYRLLPYANIDLLYEINKLDLNELGEETFHLTRFTGEVFFSNRLNWTTYVQYNTQRDNFNINSRLQWEYKPLSYVYLVVTDNFDKNIHRKNWGIAFKMNYRFDF